MAVLTDAKSVRVVDATIGDMACLTSLPRRKTSSTKLPFYQVSVIPFPRAGLQFAGNDVRECCCDCPELESRDSRPGSLSESHWGGWQKLAGSSSSVCFAALRHRPCATD